LAHKIQMPGNHPVQHELWSLRKKGGYTRQIAHLHFWILLPVQRNTAIISEERPVIFAYELQSALRLMFGFSDIHCEL
jgi:hypothetical protein